MIAPPACESPCVIRRPRVLEIIDADGEAHDYLMAFTGEGLDAWACTLTRLDGEGDSPYRVAFSLAGSWRCACPDARYRARKLRRACKHVQAVANLYLTMKEWIDGRRNEDQEETR